MERRIVELTTLNVAVNDPLAQGAHPLKSHAGSEVPGPLLGGLREGCKTFIKFSRLTPKL